MREAMGGTWLFGIVILFIALFASFLAYSISYTRAFNTKNEIINLIERNEGYTRCSQEASVTDTVVGTGSGSTCDVEKMTNEQLSENPSVETQAFLRIRRSGYNYSSAKNIPCDDRVGHLSEANKTKPTEVGGYCITKYCQENSEGQLDRNYSVYYKVTTFIALTLPVVNITFNVPITGETRTMYFDNGAEPCDARWETGRN